VWLSRRVWFVEAAEAEALSPALYAVEVEVVAERFLQCLRLLVEEVAVVVQRQRCEEEVAVVVQRQRCEKAAVVVAGSFQKKPYAVEVVVVVAGATMMQLAWEVAEVERRWRGLLAAVAAAVAETQAHRPVEPAGPAVHESLLAAGAMGVAAETCQAASLVVAVAPFLEAASFRVGTAASLPATAVPWSAPLSRSRREARTHTHTHMCMWQGSVRTWKPGSWHESEWRRRRHHARRKSHASRCRWRRRWWHHDA